MISKDAFIATHRFGFGPSADDVKQAQKNPKTWLYAQMSGFDPAPASMKHLPTTEHTVKEALAFMASQRNMKGKSEAKQKARKKMRQETRKDLMQEISARTLLAAKTSTPFMERLVHFWSNHFTVSSTRKEAIAFIGPYEREIIRPNILGKFSDMVLAVTQHPAMLLYLDNIQSIGPNSVAGKKKNKGLNENLARELLELHTLGVDGGYAQKDVQELAKMLTGWSVDRKGKTNGFKFQPLMHEPGPKTLLGKTYKENGVNEVKQAIIDLCAHPSTARFIATKLAQHFVADTPPKSAIKKLETVYKRSGGDLKAVTKALIDLDEAWDNPTAKAKTPNELIIATLRVFDGETKLKDKQIAGILKNLNQLPYSAPSPAGWDDHAEAWISPEALLRRVEWCRLVGKGKQRDINIEAFLAQTLGDVASPQTRFSVLRAPSKADALALLMASPEFQRR